MGPVLIATGALVGFMVVQMVLLWLFYLAVMNLQRVRDAGLMTPFARGLGTVFLYVGLFQDFLANVVTMSVIMLEPPREWLVTARLKRHAPRQTWRGAVARWMARNLLDAYDPTGKHV